jgi:hypothetical protein
MRFFKKLGDMLSLTRSDFSKDQILTSQFLKEKGFKEAPPQPFGAPIFNAISIIFLSSPLQATDGQELLISFKKETEGDLAYASFIAYHNGRFYGNSQFITVLSTKATDPTKTVVLHQDFGRASTSNTISEEMYAAALRGIPRFIKKDEPVHLTNFESKRFNDLYNVYINNPSKALSRQILEPTVINYIEKRDEPIQFELIDGWLHCFIWQNKFSKNNLEKLFENFAFLKTQINNL